MNGTKSKIVVIVGPTASGKTSLSINLAKKFSAEIISADSRQIYRGLDIGSGKVTKQEMKGVPHHLLDIINPTDTYTADAFKKAGSLAIEEITSRNHLPIIAGGTFFYVDTLLGRVTTPEIPPNPTLRAQLETYTTDELYSELRERDPRRASEMDPHNGRRLIRALEIVATLGAVPVIPTDEPYDVLTIGIITTKEELRARFKQRAEEWLELGLMSEVKNLLASGVSRKRLQEIGFEYLLAIELFEKNITTEEFLQKFIEKNWQYAKKQLMWLKRDETIQWFEKDDMKSISKSIQSFLVQ